MRKVIFALTLCICTSGAAFSTEILRWQRLPLSVPLIVGQERVVFVDRRVRVAVPVSVANRLRVQTASGAVYLRASAPIEATRLQLQDVETGALILIDISAEAEKGDRAQLEPVRIVDAEREPQDPGEQERASRDTGGNSATPSQGRAQTPIPVVLTRYASQSLYAPLRTVEPVSGIAPVPIRNDLKLQTLLPGLSVQTKALAAWRLHDHWVTAVLLQNRTDQRIVLDPRLLEGDFVAATFQHRDLGPLGESADTTVLYLVTRGHGLTEALLPALSPFDASLNAVRSPQANGPTP